MFSALKPSNWDIFSPHFTFNCLRDKETNSQVFGNFFIVECSFEDNKKDIIELCGERLTLPGEGMEVGPSLGANKEFLKGLFLQI